MTPEIKETIDISIIIPVYNAGKLIKRCLDSIYDQHGDYNYEVIVIDDGSTDNSVSIIKTHPVYNRIKLISQVNQGPSVARNKGIMQAKGKYLAFIDADDYWFPDFINKTISFLEKNTCCIAVSVAQKHLTTAGEYEWPESWHSICDSEGMIVADFFDFWGKRNHICTGSITIRTDVAKIAGGMREDLLVCEDLEFWAYLSTFGNIGYIPSLLFVSDGKKVTQEIGWVAKNLPRWNNAVELGNWQTRILEKISSEEIGRFDEASGSVGRNLAYSILMSKRFDLARNQIKKYGKFYPSDSMTRLLRIGASNKLLWFVISRFLVYREYHRK